MNHFFTVSSNPENMISFSNTLSQIFINKFVLILPCRMISSFPHFYTQLVTKPGSESYGKDRNYTCGIKNFLNPSQYTNNSVLRLTGYCSLRVIFLSPWQPVYPRIILYSCLMKKQRNKIFKCTKPYSMEKNPSRGAIEHRS